MTDDPQDDRDAGGQSPSTADLEEPSTEKEPGQEPKGGDAEDEPSHQAVGIGVIDSGPAPSESNAAEIDESS